MSELRTRKLGGAEHAAFFELTAAAFLEEPHEDWRAAHRELFDPERAHGVFAGSELVGGGEHLCSRIALPGGVDFPLAAVTSVGVRPGHRRQGVLTELMRAQLESLRGSDEPLAGLVSSEGGIYGRFGYGVSTRDGVLTAPRGSRFRSTVDIDPRPVRELGLASGEAFATELCGPLWTQRPGWLAHDANWRNRVRNQHAFQWGAGKLRCAAHPDGYVFYRPKPAWSPEGPEYGLRVVELVARTPAAYAALWRYLLDTDLVAQVTWPRAAVDEPLLTMLENPRSAELRVLDGLWLRPVDLDRVLVARQYSAPCEVVLDVTDAFCPWNAGRWRLRAGVDGVAEVERTSSEPDLALDVSDLAAAYLGGTSLATLAAAGRVGAHAPEALGAATRAFATERAPHCPRNF